MSTLRDTYLDQPVVIQEQGCHGTGKTGNLEVDFSRQENTGNLPKILNIWFYTGNLTSTQGKFGGERKKMSV